MHEVKQILKVLQNISSKPTSIVQLQKGNNKESQYLTGLINGEFTSDNDAALKLYGTSQGDVRYKMLKYRVKKKLYNSLLTAEIANDHTALQKEMECIKLLNLAKLLLRQNEYQLVQNLCSKVVAITKQLEFNDHLLSAYEIELAALTNQGSLKVFNEKRKAYTETAKVVAYEKEAAALHQLVRVHLKSTVKVRKTLITELPATISRMREIVTSAKSFEAFQYYYRTSVLFYELSGDFKDLIDLTENAANQLVEGKINQTRFDIRYNAFMLVYAHLRSKEYNKGLEYASEFYNLFDITTKNWFAYMENYFLLAIHAKQYELAVMLLHRVRSNSNYNNISTYAKERWQLYTAYLYFIDSHSTLYSDFNYQSFINSITEYSKDKQGFNVAILILQFMYFLKKGDTEGLLYRIESLKKYVLTHLKDSFSLRSKLFLRLLMLTVTEDYDAASCRAKGTKHYQKLIETPTPGDAYAEIEIVPYEHLWELILDDMAKANA